MRDQAGRNGETGEARAEPGTGKANCKAEPGRTERNTGRPTSRKRGRSGRKKAEGKRKIRKARAGSKHLRNSCGSESGKGERKQTVGLSTRTVKECMRNQAEGSGENIGNESGR